MHETRGLGSIAHLETRIPTTMNLHLITTLPYCFVSLLEKGQVEVRPDRPSDLCVDLDVGNCSAISSPSRRKCRGKLACVCASPCEETPPAAPLAYTRASSGFLPLPASLAPPPANPDVWRSLGSHHAHHLVNKRDGGASRGRDPPRNYRPARSRATAPGTDAAAGKQTAAITVVSHQKYFFFLRQRWR